MTRELTMPNMPKLPQPAVLLFLAALAACGEGNPAEVRDDAPEFSVIRNWTASAAPIGTSPVSAKLALEQYDGYRIKATLTFTGAPNATYQWRIFRGDCATTAVAANNTAPTGLLRFSTDQVYPNVTTNAAGAGTVSATIAGALDPLTAYSVRVRVAQSAINWNGTNPVSCGNLRHSAAGR
jgi:hypothetical protein